jgi:carbon storage regulator
VLILTRRAGEAILLDGGIRVIVIATERGQVRLGIEAPPQVNILRQEIVDDIIAGTVAAVATPEALARLGIGPVQPAAPRSKRRAATSDVADQSAVTSSDTATTKSPSVRKPKRKVVADPDAESTASSN